ncbi:uncharacterized protein CBL_02748 [Carabus blaptoides fortunei]
MHTKPVYTEFTLLLYCGIYYKDPSTTTHCAFLEQIYVRMLAAIVGCETSVTGLLAIVGAVVICFFLLDTVFTLLQYARGFLSKYFLPHENHTLVAKYGKWAVITGSTDGIGKQYALELAARDMNIVLISRNMEKLRNTAQEIESKYSVKTKIIVADFSRGSEVYEHIENELLGIPVAVLVNNVGMQYSYPKYVSEASEKELSDLINVNVGAVTHMSKMLLPQMRQRGKGAIVNVSSGSEMQPLPLMTVYAATKAYVKSFTEALRFEYARQGITVQHLSPLFINTKMNEFSHRLRQTSFFVPDAVTYAKYAVKTLGVVDHTTGYWGHGIQSFFMSIFPEWVRMYSGAYLNQEFRKDYFKSMTKSN